MKKEIVPPFVPSMRQSNFDSEFNEMPIDFEEQEYKWRVNTERRQSYYIESTVQSKNCTENSFYFNKNPSEDNSVNNNEASLNNFFANPGDDVKDIYNDSSGTNKSSNANTSI